MLTHGGSLLKTTLLVTTEAFDLMNYLQIHPETEASIWVFDLMATIDQQLEQVNYVITMFYLLFFSTAGKFQHLTMNVGQTICSFTCVFHEGCLQMSTFKDVIK